MRIGDSLLSSVKTYAPDLYKGLADAVHEEGGTPVRICLASEAKKKWGFLSAPQKYKGKRMTRRACLEGYAIKHELGFLVVIPDPKALRKVNWAWKPWLRIAISNALRLHTGEDPFTAPGPINLPSEWTFK